MNIYDPDSILSSLVSKAGSRGVWVGLNNKKYYDLEDIMKLRPNFKPGPYIEIEGDTTKYIVKYSHLLHRVLGIFNVRVHNDSTESERAMLLFKLNLDLHIGKDLNLK
jgi:hypothetical protein